jgi:hypothetical protein
MVYLINVNDKTLHKDCNDFVCLVDGTRTGDHKYCNLSQLCRQVGMKSDWYQFFNHETKEYDFDYFCQGYLVTEENKKDDDEVS